MKILIASLLFLVSHSVAIAGPVTLLDCVMEGAPIEAATVSSYMGRLFLITRPLQGDGSSRVMSQNEWDKRLIYLIDDSEMKGVLYFREGSWFYTFKDSRGWRMAGDASCAETLQ